MSNNYTEFSFIKQFTYQTVVLNLKTLVKPKKEKSSKSLKNKKILWILKIFTLYE